MNKQAKRVVYIFSDIAACFFINKDEINNKNEILDKDFLDFICKKN